MDWKTRFSNYLPHVINKPFKWGAQDCCMFAADSIYVMTGIDILEEYRNKYSSAKGAQKILDEHGGTLSKFLTVVCRKHGLKKAEPNIAQNGSLCLIKTDIGDAAAILWNGKVWAQGPDGVITAPKSVIKRIWNLPRR